jgi:trans-aconitate methyltransferase
VSLPVGYFEDMYSRNDDPWEFNSRWYERRKYALTVAALRRPRYRSAFEPGCSLGVLTELLAGRCDQLLAADISPQAVSGARNRLARYNNVTVDSWTLPDWPAGPFDLIVLSEVGYYLDTDDLAAMLDSAVASLEPAGDLVAVHWRHPVEDYPQTGDAVHAAIGAQPGLHRVCRHEEEDFLLEVFARTPPAARSVARIEGLC